MTDNTVHGMKHQRVGTAPDSESTNPIFHPQPSSVICSDPSDQSFVVAHALALSQCDVLKKCGGPCIISRRVINVGEGGR